MARYFFDVLANADFRRDWLGKELPSFQSATREAYDRCRLLLTEDAVEGEDPRTWMMVTREEDVGVLFAFRVSVVLAPEPQVSRRLQ